MEALAIDNDNKNGNGSPPPPPDDIAPIIINICSSIVMYAGGFLELACFILFIHNFYKKSQYFCTAYFYLLSIGYLVDLIGIFFQTLDKYFISDDQIWFVNANNLIRWYSGLFLGPWNTFLAINRCTAILFWNKHIKIWNGPSLFRILFLCVLYPFLVNGYMFKDSFCLLNRHDSTCESIDKELSTFEMISNGINVILSAFLGIITALSRRLKLTKISDVKRKFETQLLIQSILSSIFFGFYCLFGVLVIALVRHQKELQVTNSILMSISSTMSSCYYIYFHISATILLFALSETVRQSFIKFYGLDKLYLYSHKFRQNNNYRRSAANSRVRPNQGVSVF